jgi:deoxycytidylate deaminase
MSPRQDTYMTLCLEQALKSPLHYRHGCIIVRGGKVIGRGFNHYRPGFNGGALKDGRTKIAGDVLQQKTKQKHTCHAREELPGPNGGGSDANMALSLHSEMMAIRSALSLSSHHSGASARSNAWYETPCFKLPGHSTLGHTLRKEKIRQYMERVCVAAEKSEGKIESDCFPAQTVTSSFESRTFGFDQVLPQFPQRTHAEFEKEPEREAEREQNAVDAFAAERNWSAAVSESIS